MEPTEKRDVATRDWPPITGYVLEEVIGRGGMGRVYRARDAELGRCVAIKFLLHAEDESIWRRFADEARAIAQLQHPNVARLYEFHADPHQPYLVMEYIGGGTLSDFVGDRPIDAALACRIVATLARAIDAAHRQGIIHRDLKPSNILIADESGSAYPTSRSATAVGEQDSTLPDGGRGPLNIAGEAPPALDVTTLRIADFGLAKQIATDARHTLTGEIVGTPDYMSPEQASGVVSRIGPSTDIYSLGAILYKLITGRPPFVGSDTLDTIMMVLTDEPIAPRTLVRRLPVDVQTICLKCLEKNPSRRYGNAAELADDLDRFQRGEPIHARPVSFVERLIKWARRRPWQAFATALLAISIIGGCIGIYLLQAAYDETRIANQKLTSANQQLVKAVRNADQAYQISRDGLGRIVESLSYELYEVPQAERLARVTAQDSVELHRQLVALRPDDVTTLHQLVRSLDIHRLSEWTYGNHEASQQVMDELIKLVDASCKQRPDDVFLTAKQTSLWMELADQRDPNVDPVRHSELEEKIQQQLDRLLEKDPNDPDVSKTASKQSERLVNRAVEQGDLASILKFSEERVAHSRRFARHSQNHRHAALQWLMQSLVTYAKYQIAARDYTKAADLLDEAQKTLDQAIELEGLSRANRSYSANIRATLGKSAALQSSWESAAEHLLAAENMFQQLFQDFPEDVGLAMPLAETQVDLAAVLLAQQQSADAESRLQDAAKLADMVLQKIPDDYLATLIQQRIDSIRASYRSSDESSDASQPEPM